jgi:hypothetical protein
MTYGWNAAEELTEKHMNANSGLFVRLANDRDKVVGVFLGEPYARETHWIGERYELCTGEGCRLCAEGTRASLRVALNLYVPAEGQVKVMEGSASWFKDVMKARTKYGLDKWMFEIERQGAAGDPKTKYSILPEEKIDPGLAAHLGTLQLHDLTKAIAGDKKSAPIGGNAKVDALIDMGSASHLIGRLKSLPREAVDTFLEKFGVDRVRDLKVSEEKAALTALASLEAKYLGQQGQTEEIDPFA